MKSTKLLSSSIAAALVASITVPVITQAESINFKDLSTSSIYYNDIEWLVSKGIIGGFEDGTFRPNDALTREQAVSMFVRALGLEIPTNIDSVIEKYNDINKDSWSTGQVAAFINAGISDDVTTFGPKQPLTREVMATWLVRAFDIKGSNTEKVPFTDVGQISIKDLPNVEILYENKIVGGRADGTFAPKDPVTRAQFTAFMKRALMKYEGEGTQEEVVTTPFQIIDAKPINLKQIKLTTNRTGVNEQFLLNSGSYKVEAESGTIIKAVDVQLNQKEIIVTLERALKNKATLVVDKSITGKEEDFNLSFKDEEVPKLVNVTPTSQYSYVMTFSEPLDFGVENGKRLYDEDFFKTIKINGDLYTIDRMTVLQHGQALHVEQEVNLREGNHKLEILDEDLFEDYAGNELDITKFDFSMKYEKTAPKLLEVKNVQPDQVTLVFDKYIKLRSRGSIYHTAISNSPSSATVQNGNELVLTFDSKKMITKSTDIVLENGAIVDLWGNPNTKLTKSIVIEEDKQAPTISSVEFIDSTVASSSYIKMKVTFSESVKRDSARDFKKYELTDEKGNTIKIRDIFFENNSASDKVAIFTIDKYYGDVPPQRFTLMADELEDLVGNESNEVKHSFTASSEKSPGDFKAKMALNEREDEVLIAIDFGKKMSSSGNFSVKELGKYQLTVDRKTILLEDLLDVNGLEVSIVTTLEGRQAEILLKKRGSLARAWDDFFDDLVDAIEDEDLDGLALVIGRVADQNGNRTDSIVNEVKLSVQGKFDKNQVTAKATDTDTIQLRFEDTLNNFTEKDFIVYYDRDRDLRFDANEELETKITMETINGESILTIKLVDDELDTDAQLSNRDVYVTTNDRVKTTNRFGQKIEISRLLVEDGIAPKIETYRGEEQVYVQPVQNDTKRAIVTVEFTDHIDKDTLTRLSFVIGNGKRYVIESVFVENNDKVCLVVQLNDNKLSDLVGEYVKQKAAISDGNDNIIQGIDVRINEERRSRTNP